LDPAVQFPEDAKKLGHWVGMAHDVGSLMMFWILPASCRVIARSMVSSLTGDDELADPVVQGRIAELDLAIKEKIGDSTLKEEEIDADLLGIFPEIPDDIFLPDHDAEYSMTQQSLMQRCQRRMLTCRRHMMST
jgi:hypothetical protein